MTIFIVFLFCKLKKENFDRKTPTYTRSSTILQPFINPKIYQHINGLPTILQPRIFMQLTVIVWININRNCLLELSFCSTSINVLRNFTQHTRTLMWFRSHPNKLRKLFYFIRNSRYCNKKIRIHILQEGLLSTPFQRLTH